MFQFRRPFDVHPPGFVCSEYETGSLENYWRNIFILYLQATPLKYLEVFDSLSLHTGNLRTNTLAWLLLLVLEAKLTILNRCTLHYVLTSVNKTSDPPKFMLQFNKLCININEAWRPLKQTSERGDVKCLGLPSLPNNIVILAHKWNGNGERKWKHKKADKRSWNHCCRGKAISVKYS